MADDNTIDPSEYTYSKEKYEEMLTDLNITQAVAETNEIESDDSFVEETEINQICIYIRNYDSSGKLLDNPSSAVKTCIDTFERTLIKVNWTEREAITNEDGTITYKKISKEEIRETMNTATAFADEEILKVSPNIIDLSHFVSKFLKDYFNNFDIYPNDGGKTLFIEYHDISKENKSYYELKSSDLFFFKNKNYDMIGLNLNDEILIIDKDEVLELTNLSIENAKINIESETGFALKSDYFYLENCTIKSHFDTYLSTFSLTINTYAKLSYIDFSEDICKFDFLNSSTDKMNKWMNSKIDIYGISYSDLKKDINYKLENIFNFSSFYTINISSITIVLNSINMTFMKLSNIMSATLSSINITANEINKNLISLTKVSNFVACGIYGTQNNKQSNTSYLFYTNQGNVMGEYKFTSIISNNIGLINSNNESVSQISFNSIRCNGFNIPFKSVASTVYKYVFSKTNFDRFNELKIVAPKVSIFDSNITNIGSLIFEISEKLYINNSSLTGDSVQIELSDDSAILLDSSKINFKEITINGENTTGSYKDIKTEIIGNSLKFSSMGKIASDNSIYKIENVELVSNNISGFKPSFNDGKVRNIKVTGNVTNSLLFINYDKSSKIKYDLNACKGNLAIYYNDYVSNLDIELENADIDVTIDATKDNDEIDSNINIKCGENATGSSIRCYKSNMKYVPKSEGRFTDLEYFSDVNEDLDSKKWKDKVAYGYLSEE